MNDAFPTLLLPGIGGGSASLLPLAHRLRREGVYAKRLPLPPILFHDVEHYAKLAAKAIVRLSDATGRRVAVVGWSLGGKYGALALGAPDVAARVRLLITFGTPHDGTIAGHLGFPFRFLKGARDVLPDSPAVRKARAVINDPSRPWRMVAINGRLDPLAPYPQESIRPDEALNGYWTHLAPFTSRALQQLVATLIKRP